MLAISVADTEPIVAEVCVRLTASLAADCIPILAATLGQCAAPAQTTLKLQSSGQEILQWHPLREHFTGPASVLWQRLVNSK